MASSHRDAVDPQGDPDRASFDDTTVEGTKGSPYFKAIPAVDAQVYMPDIGVPVLWWRSVGATHTAMAMEHTIDQLARRAGRDPVEYRRAIYAKAGDEAARHLAVLNLAVEKSGYGPEARNRLGPWCRGARELRLRRGASRRGQPRQWRAARAPRRHRHRLRHAHCPEPDRGADGGGTCYGYPRPSTARSS
ncbi:MAG: hypothetical protein WDN69_15195 [Aliidongia sp.]